MTEDEETRRWADEQEDKLAEGRKMLQDASTDALEYVQQAIENMDKQQWRKMVVEQQAVEIGVGKAFAEHLVPLIYNDMPKSFRKKLKVNKTTAQTLREIYIGRVIKNIAKELNKSD